MNDCEIIRQDVRNILSNYKNEIEKVLKDMEEEK
jgi:hypothetical protein